MELIKKYWYVIAIVVVLGVVLYMRKQKTGKWLSFDEYGDDEYGDDDYAGGKGKMISGRMRNKMAGKRMDRKARRTERKPIEGETTGAI